MAALYDKIGVGYRNQRKTEPRIAAMIRARLGRCATVVNVGAGTGSYEPSDRQVVAVEPSAAMIGQRPPGAAPAVLGIAEALPFADRQFDAAMAVLTLHHWSDVEKGLAEMTRVARDRLIIWTFDPEFSGFWLEDYVPELLSIDRHQFPCMADFRGLDFPVKIEPVMVPHDCVDGFLCAYWRRPAAYLDAEVRRSMSPFSKIDNVEPGLKRLEADLKSGAWAQEHGELLAQDEADTGYRLITVAL